MMKYLTGSCLCRKVKIQVPDIFDWVGYCHCSECRKFSGSAFASAAGVDFEDFEITQGEEFVAHYHKSEDTDLGFCSNCGSSLFSKKLETKIYYILLGILDDPPAQKPASHIFVGSKAPWYEITDDISKFDAMPPSE
jgi:hypothetical protein